MRHLLGFLIIQTISLATVDYLLPGFTTGNTAGSLIGTAVVLVVLRALLKPLLNIILLPLNILTLGLAKWGSDAIIVFFATHLLPNFSITAYSLGPLEIGSLTLPKLVFSPFWGFLFAVVCLNLTTHLLESILRPSES